MAKMYYNFNAPHKIAMGLIPASEVKTVARAGTYTVIGSEFDRSGTRVVKIKADDEVFGANAYFYIEYRQPLPEFSKSMASEFVVTVWTEDITEATHYVESLDCRRTFCDSVTLGNGSELITITALYEGTGKGQFVVETTDVTDGGN
jgi:hypothetical protein